MGDERADAVVVGARCAGSASASMLARAGRRVVVLDRARFPSDTLSTHLMFPSGCSEFQRIGAWESICEQLRPAQMRFVRITLDNGVDIFERLRAVDGIDHGVSIPRIQLDQLLVENARGAGADVRERSTVTELLWEAGRVSGVVYKDADGSRRRIRSKLVVGADGRRSSVAAAVGAWRPYRASRNGRGLVFRYMDDPHPSSEWAQTLWQWRDGDSLAFAFPNPRGRILILFMGDRREAAESRSDPERYWQRKLDQHPGCRQRIEGCSGETKLRSTGDTVAFFRASSGPGWALAGDAGHFKDPVIGQGMRDALWMGRTLGEATATALDQPAELDRCLRVWEADRDAECLPAYHFANQETRVRHYSPILAEALRHYGGDEHHPEIGDLFQRLRMPQEVLTLPRLAGSLARAVVRSNERRVVVRDGLADALVELRVRREIGRGEFRGTGTIAGSDHQGWSWAPEPAHKTTAPEPSTEAEPADPQSAVA